MRPAERFLWLSCQLLARPGYVPDPGRVERTGSGCIVLCHYTHPKQLDAIRATGGLRARLPVLGTALPPTLEGNYLIETLLDPFPLWLSCSPYFGDLALEMMRENVGDLLLRLELPPDFPGLYVADYGHVLERKHEARYGSPVLGLRRRSQVLIAAVLGGMPVGA